MRIQVGAAPGAQPPANSVIRSLRKAQVLGLLLVLGFVCALTLIMLLDAAPDQQQFSVDDDPWDELAIEQNGIDDATMEEMLRQDIGVMHVKNVRRRKDGGAAARGGGGAKAAPLGDAERVPLAPVPPEARGHIDADGGSGAGGDGRQAGSGRGAARKQLMGIGRQRGSGSGSAKKRKPQPPLDALGNQEQAQDVPLKRGGDGRENFGNGAEELREQRMQQIAESERRALRRRNGEQGQGDEQVPIDPLAHDPSQGQVAEPDVKANPNADRRLAPFDANAIPPANPPPQQPAARARVKKDVVNWSDRKTGHASMHHSDKRQYELVIGITNGARQQPTLPDTLESLMPWIDPTRHKVIVWRSFSTLGDGLNEFLESKYPSVEVLQASREYLELNPSSLKLTHNDTLDRVQWRSGHVLDYANLVRACRSYKSDYVLILEDDIEVSKNFLTRFNSWFTRNNFANRPDWAVITLYSDHLPEQGVDFGQTPLHECQCGAVALFYRANTLAQYETMLRRDYFEDPVDFLFIIHYQYEQKLKIYEHMPSLVQHVGRLSTLLTSLSLSPEQRQEQIKIRSRWRSRTYVYDEEAAQALKRTPFRSKDGYIGCYADDMTRRDLLGSIAIGEGHTPSTCRKVCGGFPFMGLQGGGDCFCGTEFGRYGQLPERDCDNKCDRDPLLSCGGLMRNSVYRV